jgi:hypothetical protein
VSPSHFVSTCPPKKDTGSDPIEDAAASHHLGSREEPSSDTKSLSFDFELHNFQNCKK